jgi:O-acetyl-ADP-ribose deacetylase (regulator of RNase III)
MVGMRPGDVVIHDRDVQPQRVISFATKGNWRFDSRIEWVAHGLTTLAGLLVQVQPESVAIPAVGCGKGQLAWSDVRPLVHAAAEKMSAVAVDVFVYEPQENQ